MEIENEPWNEAIINIPPNITYVEEAVFEEIYDKEKIKPGKYKLKKTFELENTKELVLEEIYFTIE